MGEIIAIPYFFFFSGNVCLFNHLLFAVTYLCHVCGTIFFFIFALQEGACNVGCGVCSSSQIHAVLLPVIKYFRDIFELDNILLKHKLISDGTGSKNRPKSGWG